MTSNLFVWIRVYCGRKGVVSANQEYTFVLHFFCVSVRTETVKNRLFVVVSILLVVLAAAPAFAGSKKKKTSAAPKYHPPVISSVIGNTITVTEEKTTRAFTVTQFTEITVNGQRATIAGLKPGMTVTVTIGVDPTQASRINATGVPTGGNRKKK
jgi:hypothetical protein